MIDHARQSVLQLLLQLTVKFLTHLTAMTIVDSMTSVSTLIQQRHQSEKALSELCIIFCSSKREEVRPDNNVLHITSETNPDS